MISCNSQSPRVYVSVCVCVHLGQNVIKLMEIVNRTLFFISSPDSIFAVERKTNKQKNKNCPLFVMEVIIQKKISYLFFFAINGKIFFNTHSVSGTGVIEAGRRPL